jgi:hypothetical protein
MQGKKLLLIDELANSRQPCLRREHVMLGGIAGAGSIEKAHSTRHSSRSGPPTVSCLKGWGTRKSSVTAFKRSEAVAGSSATGFKRLEVVCDSREIDFR